MTTIEQAAEKLHPQFSLGVHAQLTQEACPQDPAIRDYLDTIVRSNQATDLDQFHSAFHFDNCAFGPGSERIKTIWGMIQSKELEINRFFYFGTMIHTVQDFYSHSNWVELHVDADPVPVWDLELSTLPQGIMSGTWLIGSPKMCGPNTPSHGQLNKDDPSSEEGRKIVQSGPNAGKTLFDLAFAAALAATQMWFARFAEVIHDNT